MCGTLVRWSRARGMAPVAAVPLTFPGTATVSVAAVASCRAVAWERRLPACWLGLGWPRCGRRRRPPFRSPVTCRFRGGEVAPPWPGRAFLRASVAVPFSGSAGSQPAGPATAGWWHCCGLRRRAVLWERRLPARWLGPGWPRCGGRAVPVPGPLRRRAVLWERRLPACWLGPGWPRCGGRAVPVPGPRRRRHATRCRRSGGLERGVRRGGGSALARVGLPSRLRRRAVAVTCHLPSVGDWLSKRSRHLRATATCLCSAGSVASPKRLTTLL